MTAAEEKLMFLRFNFAKRKLTLLQKKVASGGLTPELAEKVLEWHRRFEHFREYLVRTNLALVLAMAKRTRLGDIDFAEIVSEGNMALIRAVDKFSVDRGFFSSAFPLSVATRTPGATIRYTLDGTKPTATTGNVYSGPITISKTTVLRAAAFKPLLTVIAALVVSVVALKVDVTVGAFLGAAILSLAGCAEETAAIKEVPWNAVLMGR